VLSIEGMPAIVDNDIRLEMGRMTPRWLIAVNPTSLPCRVPSQVLKGSACCAGG
jgi:hypothetical protein